MKAAVRRILLMSALMSPGALYALGLGEIHLNSALNQPFDADIELVAATPDDLSALRATLASSDAFSHYGIDRPAYLADFSFRVAKGAGGQDVLKVTSPRPVTEPFVTLLVEANWPRGRLLREYTVLLDPPVFAPGSGATEQPVAAPRASSAAPAGRSESLASGSGQQPAPSSDRPRRASVAAAPSIEAGSTYRVRPNDTLWRIASEAHPGSHADVNRAMVAIFQQNPAAFEGNINVLRSGSVLKIPQSGEISAISASAASAEVARQYQLWKSGAAAGAGTGEATAGRLRLVTPEQGSAAPSTSTTAAPAAAAGAQGGDLKTRVTQLESELAEARRLLEVKNAELATLQGQAAPGAAAAGPGTAAPAATTPAAGAKESPAQPGAAAAPVAEQPAAPAPKAEPPKPAPKPAAKPVEQEGPSLFERLAQYWWLLLALVAAGAGVFAFKRLRGDQGGGSEDLEEALGRDLRATRPPAARSPARETAIVVEEKRPVEASPPVAAPAAPPRAPEPTRKPVSIEDTMSGEAASSIEAGDPLAEADFHMAYGLYDQAADLVQLAIKREPKRRDLRLKLLEIFFVWGNRDRFLELARELQASRADGPAGEWDKVLIMGKQIAPEDALFAAAPRAGNAGLDMELHGGTGTFDMNLVSGGSPEPDFDPTSGGSATADETGLDFILDEPVRGADEASALAPTVETAQLGKRGLEDTEEVPIESLGLEVGSLQALGELDKEDELFAPRPRAAVEDTVENPAIRTGEEAGGETVEADLLSSTSLMKMSENLGSGTSDTSETAMLDLSDATGELPTIEAARPSTAGARTDVDFSLAEEAATMSEVGTKLDLARAYVDMGDPEGARAILDEVIAEGNAVQKQEAQRLMASLP